MKKRKGNSVKEEEGIVMVRWSLIWDSGRKGWRNHSCTHSICLGGAKPTILGGGPLQGLCMLVITGHCPLLLLPSYCILFHVLLPTYLCVQLSPPRRPIPPPLPPCCLHGHSHHGTSGGGLPADDWRWEAKPHYAYCLGCWE